MAYLIADSGATKCEWCLVTENKKQKFSTIGISPYFLSPTQIEDLFSTKVLKKTNGEAITHVHFYGTGLSNPENKQIITTALKNVFKKCTIQVNTDLLGAARSLCLKSKGIVCILGTGSNTGYYNGNKISKNSPALGYVLGDEGSGAFLGKKVIQHYLYETFDDELMNSFDKKFSQTKTEILNKVYKEPLPNKYLASFAIFLSDNRGHFMIENMIEDGLHEFIFHHLYKIGESWTNPIHFTGSIAYAFKDKIKEMFNLYELNLGKISKQPMDGLIEYHNSIQ